VVNRVFREIAAPLRTSLSWKETWKGPDRGLIHCWELGRTLALKEPNRAEIAKQGELPPSNWKGGITGNVKYKAKYGCLWYLAEWQGLRGEDLDIDLDSETTIECSRSGVSMTFTGDSKKWELPGR
jgi:hypothetical protein